MKAPPTPQEDFVRSIADGLKPWNSAKTVLERVRAKIGITRRVAGRPWALGLRNVNKSEAKKILDATTQLQQVLGSAPPETIRLIFSPLTFPLPEDVLEMFERGEAEGRAKTTEFSVMLRDVCSRCQDIMKFGPGDDPRFGHEQLTAVLSAYELIVELSTEPPTLDRLLDISALLFEAAIGRPPPAKTGQAGAPLERQCKAVLRRFRTSPPQASAT